MINKEKQEFGSSSPASKTERNPVLASTEQVLAAGTEPPDGVDDVPVWGTGTSTAKPTMAQKGQTECDPVERP